MDIHINMNTKDSKMLHCNSKSKVQNRNRHFQLPYLHLTQHFGLSDAMSQSPPSWSDPPTPRLAQRELR